MERKAILVSASGSSINFEREPLRYFDHQLTTAGEAFWLPSSVLCVAEPEAAKAVLANPDGLFEEHSDFFHTRRGPFGPRSLQLTIARAARQLLSDHVDAQGNVLSEAIARQLGSSSEWPDAGNFLIYHHLRDFLVASESAHRIGSMVDRVVERAVLAGARERRSRISRFLFRRRVFRQLEREVERRTAEIIERNLKEPRDLFDILARASAPGVRALELAELYLPFLFAVAGSVGFTLGWAIYLLGTQPPAQADEPNWIVREALRLWPIAWQLARRPIRVHEIAGIKVGPSNWVLVSPYVTQRHPAYWSEPDRFKPERWASQRDHSAFIPFGWGPHTCAAAALTIEIVGQVLTVLRREYRWTVSPHSEQPFIGPSLAPPRFRLDLSTRTRSAPEEGSLSRRPISGDI